MTRYRGFAICHVAGRRTENRCTVENRINVRRCNSKEV